MRILWVCNKPPMPVALTAGIDGSNYGGWLDSMSADLLLNSANTLMVLF